jgi:hypothetical protein
MSRILEFERSVGVERFMMSRVIVDGTEAERLGGDTCR